MIKKLFQLSFIASFILLFYSCNKDKEFGEFLVAGDEIEIAYTSLNLLAKTVRGDSVRTWDDTSTSSTHFIGLMDDPFFGKTKASIVFQARILSEPDLRGSTLDSVVLSIAYDTTRQSYGGLDGTYGFEVFRLQSDLAISENYYSNTIHEIDFSAIGRIEDLIPSFTDTMMVVEPVNGELVASIYDPHMRIRLDTTFGKELLALNPEDFINNEVFLQKLKGLAIKPLAGNGGMIYLDMTGGLTRINLYYTQRDTAKQFAFFVNSSSVIAKNFEFDHQGYPVGDALDSESGDSLLYIQSMGGPQSEFILPDLSFLEDRTVNSASIDITLAELPEDDTLRYPTFEDILVRQRLDGGELVLLRDALQFINSNTYSNVYGLKREEATGRKYFSISMTEYISALVNGEENNTVVLSNLMGASEPHRAIFYGTGHSRFKAQLNITHTDFSSN